MADRLIREIWSNQTAVDFWTEGNNGRRNFWCTGDSPGGVNHEVSAVAGVPPRGYDDSTFGGFVSAIHVVDENTQGGTGLREDMLFDIPTAGYDELYVQWSAEAVADAVGFAVGPGAQPGVAGDRIAFADDIYAMGVGIPRTDPTRLYTGWSPSLLFNTRHKGRLQCMSNSIAGGAKIDELAWAAGSMRLWCVGTGQIFPGLGSQRGYLYGGSPSPFALGSLSGTGTPLCKGGTMWGYVESDGALSRPNPPINGVGSRLPLQGDVYGFIIQVGWPKGVMPLDFGGNGYTNGVPSIVGGLTVEPFERVRFAVASIGDMHANVTFLPTGQNHQLLKGTMYAVLTKPQSGKNPETIFIDRAGKVTVEDSTVFQLQGVKRG